VDHWNAVNKILDISNVHLRLVRLVGGNTSYSGRLEVLYMGAWGTVCNDHFGDVDARVFCNQLGFG